MNINNKKENIIECLRLESREELYNFQTKRLTNWDDLHKIIKKVYIETEKKNSGDYIDVFKEEMKQQKNISKVINKGLKDLERILEY